MALWRVRMELMNSRRGFHGTELLHPFFSTIVDQSLFLSFLAILSRFLLSRDTSRHLLPSSRHNRPHSPRHLNSGLRLTGIMADLSFLRPNKLEPSFTTVSFLTNPLLISLLHLPYDFSNRNCRSSTQITKHREH